MAVIKLAERHHEARPLPIREIAEAQEIPAAFLTQILLKLKGAGLVISTRGSTGGYRLARPPEEITLIDVLRVVEGHDLASPESGPSAPALARVWREIKDVEITILTGMSIAKLVERSTSPDWVI
jgi:Rrf2 family protein